MPHIPIGILGATGMVGQQFIALLAEHPWFKVEWLGASERSAGKKFRDAAAWRLPNQLPDDVANCTVDAATPGRAPALVFSGLDSSVAGDIEAAFAKAGHLVVSNSRNYRMEPSVPLLIPEVNAEHLKLLGAQAAATGWKGRIVTNPNCSTVVLAMALAPLRPFGLKTTMITTLQAISGAGYPGVPSWDILGNVIPHIGGEEEKIETETRKILGAYQRDHNPGARAERPYRIDFRWVCRTSDRRGDHRGVDFVQGAAARSRTPVGATAPGCLSAGGEPAATTSRRQSGRRHDRHDWTTAALFAVRLQVRRARTQHDSRRRGSRHSQCRTDAS